jgi:hypothetical protein
MTAGRTMVDLTASSGLVVITLLKVARRPHKLRWHAVVQRFEIAGSTRWRSSA